MNLEVRSLFFGSPLRFYSEYQNPIKEIFKICDCFVRSIVYFCMSLDGYFWPFWHLHGISTSELGECSQKCGAFKKYSFRYFLLFVVLKLNCF